MRGGRGEKGKSEGRKRREVEGEGEDRRRGRGGWRGEDGRPKEGETRVEEVEQIGVNTYSYLTFPPTSCTHLDQSQENGKLAPVHLTIRNVIGAQPSIGCLVVQYIVYVPHCLFFIWGGGGGGEG